MKRTTLAFCLMLTLPCSGALYAAPPASSSAAESNDAARQQAIQQQMAALQARMNALAGRMAALSAKLGDEANASALHYLADSRRGMLGIAVTPDNRGLHVNAVTPGGPAERAGLEAGDTITAINGKPVGAFDGSSETALWSAEAGKQIRLGVDRDGKTLHVHVTAERLQPADWQATVRAAERAANESIDQAAASMNSPEFRKRLQQSIDDATASVNSPEFQQKIQKSIDDAMKSADAAVDSAAIARESASAAREGAAAAREREAAAREGATAARKAAAEAREQAHQWIAFASPWWGLNLAPLNPDLGRYFGTNHGVLVLSRSDEQFPELQPGDVITEVGGKSVAQPEDVQRALRGAGNDKRVDIALRRHGKALTLAMKVPPRWNLLPPPPPPPPAPPTPPKVAAPPAPPPPSAPTPPPSPAPAPPPTSTP